MFGLHGRGDAFKGLSKVLPAGYGNYQTCPGDKLGKEPGALCECSFPDRGLAL